MSIREQQKIRQIKESMMDNKINIRMTQDQLSLMTIEEVKLFVTDMFNEQDAESIEHFDVGLDCLASRLNGEELIHFSNTLFGDDDNVRVLEVIK